MGLRPPRGAPAHSRTGPERASRAGGEPPDRAAGVLQPPARGGSRVHRGWQRPGLAPRPASGIHTTGLADAAGHGHRRDYAGRRVWASGGRTGVPRRTWLPRRDWLPRRHWAIPASTGYPGETGTGAAGRRPRVPGQTDPSLRRPGQAGRLAARQAGAGRAGASRPGPRAPGAPGPTQGLTVGGPGRKPRKPRKPPSRARMWLMPVVMMVVVIVLITVAYLHFAQGAGDAAGRRVASAARPRRRAARRPPSVPGSTSPPGPRTRPPCRSQSCSRPATPRAGPSPGRCSAAGHNCPGTGAGEQAAGRPAQGRLHPGDAGELPVRRAEDHGHHRGAEPGQRDRHGAGRAGDRRDRVHQAARRARTARPRT